MSEHYFTAEPASAEERREIRVPLAGQTRAVQVAGGVFSPDRLDQGTTVLLNHVPPPPQDGTFLDLGCGWGPIALTLGLLRPAATVWAVDVNARARDLTAGNAAAHGLTGIQVAAPEDVPADVRFDVIWSNPPIRVGKGVLHQMLHTWLPRLEPGGSAYLVVAKNLGSDSLQRWLVEQFPTLAVTRLTSVRGFRILQVQA
ncbi:16S rRNA m(2)G 1207 methyltransferase [Branchiibius hedensis]|uniref:Methyltransferase small domain-containing protein n=1 Tax=Branchiibius hedensis TaxID=672460 RepID=A0A2Y8ZMH0_9MICO|nr:methyltransferase [Branchiibius hedensis]PWJ24673.1 16S rRNA m(2)G 1207 methyltransferase [Branchiibius hedensis]SSA33490.1 Methyltransferase small domain-containing protein [Branchiibius hedensis]